MSQPSQAVTSLPLSHHIPFSMWEQFAKVVTDFIQRLQISALELNLRPRICVENPSCMTSLLTTTDCLGCHKLLIVVNLALTFFVYNC